MEKVKVKFFKRYLPQILLGHSWILWPISYDEQNKRKASNNEIWLRP